MKRWVILLVSICIVLAWNSDSVMAQRGHGGQEMGNRGGMGMGRDTDASGRSSGGGMKTGHDQGDTHAKMPIGDRLAQSPQLSSRLQGLLPPGTNLQDASKGFKNLGQFVAAVHVSHNLNIPFDQLKAKMTGPSPVSLGKSIQELQPSANAKAEVKKAEKEAAQDIRETKGKETTEPQETSSKG